MSTETTHLYLLPGLGFDNRIFQRLQLHPYKVHYLNWIEPKAKESISSYARRMSGNIDTGAPGVLIGHSFGGIMAQEMAAWKKVDHIILISSIKHPDENPWYFKMLSPSGLTLFFRKPIIRATFPVWGKVYGESFPEAEQLLRIMPMEHSNHYLRWALRQVSSWKGAPAHRANITHLHGTRDRSFPIHKIKEPVQMVPGGTHLMVFNQAAHISELILSALQKD